MIIYLIRNKLNGKGYVGKTIRTLEVRVKEHVLNAIAHRAKMPIYAAIRKYGIDNFDICVLQECSDQQLLDDLEKYWISELETFKHGYNATLGGDGPLGYQHTEETKHKMSESRKGEKNPMFGKSWGKLHWTPEELMARNEKLRKNPRCHLPRTEEDKKKIGLATSIHKRKAVEKCMRDGTILDTYPSLQKAAADVNGQANKISEVLCGRRMTHKGYIWKYSKNAGEVPVEGIRV
jgi:group I intron endonuclease